VQSIFDLTRNMAVSQEQYQIQQVHVVGNTCAVTVVDCLPEGDVQSVSGKGTLAWAYHTCLQALPTPSICPFVQAMLHQAVTCQYGPEKDSCSDKYDDSDASQASIRPATQAGI